MAEQEKTKNYGLTIFADAQTNLTFKEFRKIIAGIGTDEASYSDMQKIDAVLKQCSVSIAENLDAAKNYTEEQLAQFKKVNDELIKGFNSSHISSILSSSSIIVITSGNLAICITDISFLIFNFSSISLRHCKYPCAKLISTLGTPTPSL